MYNKTVNLFLDRDNELSSALARFRHAADELWRTIDSCASTLQKIDVEDCPDPFKALRSLRETVHHYYGTFSDSQAAVTKMMARSKKALKPLQSHVDSSAMKYGLNRLPTELLSRIFLDAASDMESTIFLSHVSKQFRSIVNSSPALWRRFWLSPRWNRKQILAIAERSAFRSLKADMYPREGVIVNESDSVAAIFSLHSCLEELSIDRAYAFSEPASAIIQRFAYSKFAASPVEMPLLRTLHSDFLPHSSLAKSVSKLSLDLDQVSLANLLDFLSCTNVLQDLSIRVLHTTEEAEQEVFAHKAVRLPGLVKLYFMAWEGSMRSASIVAENLLSPSLQTLALRGVCWRMQTTSGGPFQDIIQSNTSFTELELLGFSSIDLCHIPSQVEVLMLDFDYQRDVLPSVKCSGTVSSHQIRLIRIHGEGDSPSFKEYVYHFRDILLGSGLDAVRFEFQNCSKCRNGSFNPKDVHRAFIDTDDGLY
ncbi:hypothetical protein ACEPAG_9499 [Sanghuangporus baumii]